MKEAYRVKELKYPDFKDLKALGASLIENRTQDSENMTVKWLKIKRMRFQKSDTNIVYFSYDYNGPYKKLCVHKKDPGRPPQINLEQLYTKELPISQAKKNYLKLCKTGVIPKEDHRFFQLLKTSKDKMIDTTPEPTAEEYYDDV